MSGTLSKLQQIQAILGVTPDDDWGLQSQGALEFEKKAAKERRARRQAGLGAGETSSNSERIREQAAQGGAEKYSERFLKMIPFLWEWEGTKFENDPADPGGATKFGIDQRSHPTVNIRELTEAEAIAIYWREYWQKNGCATYAFPLGEVVFNCCVNAGASRAHQILEKLPGGGHGRSTLTPPGEARAFMDEMDNFYHRLANSKPAMQKFLKGWLNRTAALRKYVGIA